MGRIARQKLLLIEQLNKRLLTEQVDNVTCTDLGCKGTYKGVEENDKGDIAHQFSNKMSNEVGNKLKELYNKKIYSKVNLDSIKMSTLGMGTGNVVYTLEIPFTKVNEPCQAYTSFDHVGGWGHDPLLNERISELQSALIPGDKFSISKLLSTPEGLQEYWIQWRNNKLQANCKGTTTDKEQTQKNEKQIVAKGNNLESFRNDIKIKTKGISVDWKSVQDGVDLNNYTLTFKTGKTKLVTMSLIWDNISKENLMGRYEGDNWEGKKEGELNTKEKNPNNTLYIVRGPEYVNGFWVLLFAIV